MAGTPTTNYNIPTYADTDAPDLSGAYNDAMNIIDTQLKANADAIVEAGGDVPLATAETAGIAKLYGTGDISGSGGFPADGAPTVKALADTLAPIQSAIAAKQDKLTAGDGISISGNKITSSVARTINSANVTSVIEDGIDATYRGAVLGVCEIAAYVDRLSANHNEEKGWLGATVPTILVLKEYVESKMAAAGAAYTGTAPIEVDNASHTISVSVANNASTTGGSTSYGTPGTVIVAGNPQTLAGAANDAIGTGEHSTQAGKTVPNCYTVKQYTTESIRNDRTTNRNGATQQLTVDMLKNLWVNPDTGFVFYKAPTE